MKFKILVFLAVCTTKIAGSEQLINYTNTLLSPSDLLVATASSQDGSGWTDISNFASDHSTEILVVATSCIALCTVPCFFYWWNRHAKKKREEGESQSAQAQPATEGQ